MCIVSSSFQQPIFLSTGFCWLKPDGFCPNNRLHLVLIKIWSIESEKTALSLSAQQHTGKRTRQTWPSKTRGPCRCYTAYQLESCST
jgi:hypothetical protein